jgi:hypothetical protein
MNVYRESRRESLPTDAAGQREVPKSAVNREGIIAVSWHDRGPDASNARWELLVAFSGDGGEIFTDPYGVRTRRQSLGDSSRWTPDS